MNKPRASAADGQRKSMNQLARINATQRLAEWLVRNVRLPLIPSRHVILTKFISNL
jgi:hypothetical protein